MLANLIVALIVTAAFAQACARYLPAAWRRQVVHVLVRAGLPQARMAAWLRTQSSCGTGCSTCKACESPAPDEAAPPAASGKRVIKIHAK
jgi:hypothetical protein